MNSCQSDLELLQKLSEPHVGPPRGLLNLPHLGGDGHPQRPQQRGRVLERAGLPEQLKKEVLLAGAGAACRLALLQQGLQGAPCVGLGVLQRMDHDVAVFALVQVLAGSLGIRVLLTPA